MIKLSIDADIQRRAALSPCHLIAKVPKGAKGWYCFFKVKAALSLIAQEP